MNFISFHSLSRLQRYLLGFVTILKVGLVCLFLIKHSFFKKNPKVVPVLPESDFTLYILGGSTAVGKPYFPRADIGKIVSYFFGGKINKHPIRIVNLCYFGKATHSVLRDAKEISGKQIAPGSAIVFLY